MEKNSDTPTNLTIPVFCDSCGEEYTTSKDGGGILLAGHVYCVKCQDKMIDGFIRFGTAGHLESRMVRNTDGPFGDFVRKMRGNNDVDIRSTYGLGPRESRTKRVGSYFPNCAYKWPGGQYKQSWP